MDESAHQLLDALSQVGVLASLPPAGADDGVDLWLEPGHVAVQVKRWSLVSEDVARRAIVESLRLPGSLLLVVVADRVTRHARRQLADAGVGYLDLRGRLALRTEHQVVNTDVETAPRQADPTSPLNGRAGIEVAARLLMAPMAGPSVRGLAGAVGRAPSTVSTILRGLRESGLVDEQHRVAGTRLFWELTTRWSPGGTPLAQEPPAGRHTRVTVPLRLGLEDVEETTGWALTDTAAAAAYGAPVAARSDQVLDFFVPDQVTVRRAVNLLGAVTSTVDAACIIRVAPIDTVCARRYDVSHNMFHWPLAHPVFVALDLARDVGRGREVLDSWTPPERWTRVW